MEQPVKERYLERKAEIEAAQQETNAAGNKPGNHLAGPNN